MARKQTALQAALAREAGRPAVRLLGLTVAMALSLAAGAVSLLQAVQVGRENAIEANLLDARERLVAGLTADVAAMQDGLRTVLADPVLRDAAAGADWPAATARFRHLRPQAAWIEFYPPELPQLVEADLQKFGYSRANMLAEARDSGMARAQIARDAPGKPVLALAQSVRDDQRLLGYAYTAVPADALVEPLQSLSFGGGRLVLRQGLLGTEVALSGGSGGGSEAAPVPIPQSILAVGLQEPELFKLGAVLPLIDSRNVGLQGAAGLLLLLLGALLAALRARASGKKIPQVATAAIGLLERLRPVAKEPDEAPLVLAPAAPVRGPAAAVPKPKPAAPGPAGEAVVDRSIFRAYDIRGVVGDTLTAETARLIGRAIGSTVRDRGLSEIVVGRDGRLSGPEMAAELIKGLRQSGCDVIDIGAVPTPVLYFATYHLNAGSGVMVTGSHNPPEYNGFKIVIGGETLAEDAIQALYRTIVEERFTSGVGGLQATDVVDDYVERITSDVQSERRLKVVVDAGNGIAGGIGPRVLEGIGCDVVPLHCEVDGTFPNHHPDPSDPANLRDLVVSVKQFGADLGVAFDGDGDRLGVVTAGGEMIYPDRLLMLFAIDVLDRNPGATVIYDVKCTGHLQDVIVRHGGSPVMWRTGHSLIKAKMREDDAELAGEMSGHFFFRERWFGFDDGIYSAARLLEILGASGRSPQERFDELPKGVSTPELKIKMKEGAHYAFMDRFREVATFPGARVSTIDGVRSDYPDGWGLVRCSNTTPSLVLRFDADNAEALARIQDVFRNQLRAVAPGLDLPF
ncbi:MAG: phosphomannomutase/phosphoglucomutase [Pseudomonadota bacterium]